MVRQALFILAATLLAANFLPSDARANLILDGSFESHSIAGNWYRNFGPIAGDGTWVGTAFDASWTISTNNVDIVSGPDSPGNAPAFVGTQYLDLVGVGSTGGVSQDFATTVGQSYSLTFEYGNNPWSTSTASASIAVGNLHDTVSHHTSTTANIFWTKYSGSFLADSTFTVLSLLTTIGGNNGGILLDDVSVTATTGNSFAPSPAATPLPATWSMLLFGFASLGFIAYRGQKKMVAAPAVA